MLSKPTTPPADPRKPQRRGLERRRSILDAAMELYARAGFRGTGLAAIGERAGVTHSAVLYHFGSARELLLAVLQERDRRQSSSLAPMMARDGIDALRNLPEVARVNEADPGYAKLFLVLQVEHLDGEPDVKKFFVKRSRLLRRHLLRVIETGQARKEIRQDAVAALVATRIMSFMEGAQVLQFLDPARMDLVALYEDFTDSLIRDLTTARGKRATSR